MKLIARFALALLPVAITIGGSFLANWAYFFFGCTGGLKNLQPCFVGSFNLQPLLGFGMFWLPLLILVAVPWSGWLLICAYRRSRAAA